MKLTCPKLYPATVAVGMIGYLMLVAVGASCCFISGHGINSLISPGALLIAAGWVYWRSRSLWPVVTLIGACTISLALGWYCLDFSCDGNTYHKEIIYNLMHGWNPFSLTELADGSASGWQPWTLHYAKLAEIESACIGLTFGADIEIGKAFNFILVEATALYVWHVLQPIIPSRKRRFWAVLAVMSNPVLLCQIPTFYIDFCTYCYTIITIGALIDHRMSARSRYILVGIVTLLAIGTKFNALFYQGLLIALALIWMVWHKRTRQAFWLACTGIGALVVGVGLMFYHPYITNLLSAGHPLYPLMGSGARDIMTELTPEQYLGHTRLFNLFYNLWYPFTNYRYFMPGVEDPLGGFGGLLLPMLLLTFVAAIRYRRQWPPLALYIITTTFLSCLCFDQAWWARYVPQLWLVPCVALIMLMAGKGEAPWLRRPMVWMMVVSMLLCMTHFERVRRYHNDEALVKAALEGTTVRVADTVLPGDRYKLDEWGVTVETADSIDSNRVIILSLTGTTIEVQEDVYDSLQQALSPHNRLYTYYAPYIFPLND